MSTVDRCLANRAEADGSHAPLSEIELVARSEMAVAGRGPSRYAHRRQLLNYLLSWPERWVREVQPKPGFWSVSSCFSGIASAEVALRAICARASSVACTSVFASESDPLCQKLIALRVQPQKLVESVLDLLPAPLQAEVAQAANADTLRRLLLSTRRAADQEKLDARLVWPALGALGGLHIARSPCVDFSQSGKCPGFAGPAIKLFLVWAVLMRRTLPLCIVFENVRSFPVAELDKALGDLYAASHISVDAARVLGFARRTRRFSVLLLRAKARLVRPLDHLPKFQKFLVPELPGRLLFTEPVSDQRLSAGSEINLKHYRRMYGQCEDSIVDLGQNPLAKARISFPGRPCMTITRQSSRLWCGREGRSLKGCELLEAQGYPVTEEVCETMGVPFCDLRDISTRRLAEVAGSALCVASVGSVLLWVLAYLEPSSTALPRPFDGEQRFGGFNAQNIAGIALAFATAGHVELQLFTALARAAKRCLCECSAQDLGHISWAFAMAGHADVQLFTALAEAAKQRLGEFNAQDVANTSWAFAKVGHADVQLHTSLARAAKQCLSEFNAQDVANTTWAFAKASHADVQLFTAFAMAAKQRLGEFSAQDIANLSWAFAMAGHADVQLFTALAEAAKQRLGEFNAQDVANTSWAFAKVGHADVQLHTSLARAAKQCLSEFSAQDVANASWAFAMAGHAEMQLFKALARDSRQCLGEFSAQDLTSAAWTFAIAGHADVQLFTALARASEQRLGEFSVHDLANTSLAFAKVGHADVQLFTALARAAKQRLDELDAQDVANPAWASSIAGQGVVQPFAALTRTAKQRLGKFDAQDVANTARDVSLTNFSHNSQHLRQQREPNKNPQGLQQKQRAAQVQYDPGTFPRWLASAASVFKSCLNGASSSLRHFLRGAFVRLGPRDRDALPVPVPPLSVAIGLSPELAALADSDQLVVLQVMDCACVAVNLLYGVWPSMPGEGRNAPQRAVQQKLLAKCCRMCSRLSGENPLSGPCALATLIGDINFLGAARSHPISADKADLLDPGCSALVNPLPFLGNEARAIVTELSRLFPKLLPGMGKANPVNKADRCEYARLVLRQFRTGKVCLRGSVVAGASTFYIMKKGKNSIREIWNGRDISRFAIPPPAPPHLASPDALLHIEA